MSEDEKETAKEEKEKKGTDYTAPKKKGKNKDVPELDKIEKLDIVGEVRVKKPGLGEKIKTLFIAADFKTVMHYVGYDVLLPAARAMIVDSATKGVERLMFGETARRRGIGMGHGSRVTYGGIVNRDRGEYRDQITRPPDPTRYPRPERNDFIFHSREEADAVLDELYNLLSVYEIVTVGALKDLMGLPQAHTDQKFGWESLKGSDIRNVHNGWLLDLPPAQPI